MSKIVVLFDIDGTLIRTGGAGKRALDRSLDELHGITGGMSRVQPGGKTDPLIVREIFEKLRPRHSLTPAEIQKALERYVHYLSEEIESAETFRVLPGLPGLLEELEKSGRAVVGLATGNVETGARVKLARADLNRFFPFGGFSSDHEVRVELTKIAVQRGRERAGGDIPGERVFVVGDTPHDISCAKAAGVRSLAVATGPHPAAELKPHGPDLLLEDLSDTRAILKWMGV